MSRWISVGDFTPKHSVRCLELQFAENEKSTFDLNPWESLSVPFQHFNFHARRKVCDKKKFCLYFRRVNK